jgi:orotate phosphoribosyltransferase
MELMQILQETEAVLQGHFLLTSGRHSGWFIQCAQVMQYPDKADVLCGRLAEEFRDFQIETVIGPAVGGIIVAYEVARHLNVRAIYADKKEGKLTLGRGFRFRTGEKTLVVEDVTTTGGSVKKVIEIVKQYGGEPVGVGVLVDRTAGQIQYPVPSRSVVQLEVESYSSEECPLCKQGIALMDPDTRQFVEGQASSEK